MISKTACLYSAYHYPFNRKICGLYPLERLIHVLHEAGIRRFYLDLCHIEQRFFNKHILSKVQKLHDIELITETCTQTSVSFYRIPTNLFIQKHHFDHYARFFVEEDNAIIPVINDEQFPLRRERDIQKGAKLLQAKIVGKTSTSPVMRIYYNMAFKISVALGSLGIHPSIITGANFLLSVICALFVLNNEHWSIALAGFLLQAISLFDGISIQVARLTYRDTIAIRSLNLICDHVATLCFLGAATYLYLQYFTGFFAILFPVLLVTGLINYIILNAMYLKHCKAVIFIRRYQKEFLKNLPLSSPVSSLARSICFLSRREFYIAILFLISITGRIHYVIPVMSVGLLIGTAFLMMVTIRYHSVPEAV